MIPQPAGWDQQGCDVHPTVFAQLALLGTSSHSVPLL